MKQLHRLIALLAALCAVVEAEAQYYTWGSDAPMKWQQREGNNVRIIAPDTASQLAARTLHYIHAVQPTIGEGFRYGPMEIPFVLHPQNADANGLVMYLPKRVEFLAMPAIESYSMPWNKQLVAHEYRHAVQYNNLNRGVPRLLSWFLGQQGSVTGLLYMPLWALEGDAVMNETLMSTYGRGLQPSFSMAYRAWGDQIGRDHRGRARKNVDRWFSGSYRDHIPDHYALGYQMSSFAYDRYGENIWDKVGRYGVRNPYVIAATHVGLKRYYNTSVRELFHATFDDLQAHWAPLARVEENNRTLTGMDTTNYTTYRWPMALNEAEILAVKSDLGHTARLVTIDSQGNERLVAHVGLLTSRPELHRGHLYWTELSRSTLFEEQVFSQLWQMDLTDERPRKVQGIKQALYPTSSDEGLAWVEYRPEGRYALMVEGKQHTLLPVGVELHGLTWDNTTQAFYTLVTADEGMSIARIDREGLHAITQPAYITLSDLRAHDGMLYFGSIYSGRDEVHLYDLLQRREYRLSQSKYGSFAPAPAAGGLLMTTYDRRGYRLTRLTEALMEPVTPRSTPHNLVNPTRRTWQTINLDTVRFTAEDATRQAAASPAKRYRKGLHLAGIHSWAPVAFDPFQAVDEHEIDLNAGATILSQNLLSNTEGYASYGWNEREGSVVDLGVRYNGLGVVLSLDGRYGGDQQFYSLAYYDKEAKKTIVQPQPAAETYYSFTLGAALPLFFDRGSHTQMLSLSTSYNYSNGQVARMDQMQIEGEKITNIAQIGYEHGLHKLSFGVAFTDQANLAHRDFLPRLGYSLSIGYALDPSNRNFSNLYSLYGSLYLPGFGAHNSIQVAASYQNSTGGYRFPSGYRPLTFHSSALIPRGFSGGEIYAERYASFSGNYRLPLCYPEWGIPSVLYIKRVRLGVGYDAAQFDYVGRKQQIWSVGGELAFDFNVLRMPDSATSSLTLSCFRTSKSDTWISASLGLPF